VIVGTDPVLSVILATIWKTLRPRTRVAHWCFDLFPEAAIADGLLKQESGLVKMLKPALRSAYRSCDLLVDIGSCMRARLEAYRPSGQQVTLTPWALAEPERPLTVDDQERSAIFGDARLALLYSGNFGRAHASDLILQLARRLEPHGTRVAFSVRGNRVDALRSDAANIPNVVFRPFAAQANLEARLSAADIHVVSVRDGFTGTVVPSKFFGALAAGRPVLYSGSPDSCIANWIHEHQVGWVLTQSNLEAVAAELVDYSQNSGRLARLFDHCHNVYRRHFSKKMVADRWDAELRRLLEETDQARAVDSSGSLPVRPS
jgi:colanic acid biosynthesis glycosyl transferase WcaI